MLGLLFVYRYGTNIGWEDSFDFTVELLQKWYAGTLAFADVWAQQNEHRLLFGYLASLYLALATHWNAVAEMYLSQLFLLAMMAIYLSVFLHTCASPFRAWLFVPIAVLTFSVRQYQPMLMNESVMQSVLAAVAAIYLLHLFNNRRWLAVKFLAAVSFAVIGSYTQGQALIAWPMGLVPLALCPLPKRSKFLWGAIWCATAAIVVFLYFWGWTRVAVHPPPGFSPEYFATIAGAALFPDVWTAMIGGLILLAVSAASIVLALRAGKAQQYSFWLALSLYGIVVNAEITFGRTGFGPGQAMSSRYAVTSLPTIIGLYAILSSLNGEKSTRAVSSLWGATVALIALGISLSSINGYQVATVVKQQRDYHVFVFLTADTQPDEALPSLPNHEGKVIRRELEFLKKHQLSVFHAPKLDPCWTLPVNSLPTLPIPARIQMNQVQINNEHGQAGLFTFSGIALDPKENEPVGGVFLDVDNITYPTYYGMPLPDVALALKSDRATNCGFRREFSISQLGPGRHVMKVRAVSADLKHQYSLSEVIPFEFPALPEKGKKVN